ncbi:MAG: hypothetical protein WCC06_03555 [Candidatus Aminicenantales bacterium]
MSVSYQFVNYGENIAPQDNTLVLDVGMKTVPGVIDHHHPEAEPECTASLIAKYPRLVLDHIGKQRIEEEKPSPQALTIITHRLPDFDSLASIFLSLKLIEKGRLDSSMQKIAAYTRLVDSASLPREVDLTATPYSILRALFSGSKKTEDQINAERVEEGLKFMRFLYSRAEEGYEITENRRLFSGIDRYVKAMHKVEGDYFSYLTDLSYGQSIQLMLPSAETAEKIKADGLVVTHPRSFLLKEWARRDKTNSSLHEGFAFLMTNFGNKRYILGVDPEKGVNLRGLGAMLNERESQKCRTLGRSSGLSWYEGNCPFFNYRIIDSPQDGTSLSQSEIVETILSFGRIEVQ